MAQLTADQKSKRLAEAIARLRRIKEFGGEEYWGNVYAGIGSSRELIQDDKVLVIRAYLEETK